MITNFKISSSTAGIAWFLDVTDVTNSLVHRPITNKARNNGYFLWIPIQ